MAITIHNQPSALLVGDAAYQAGLGEFRQRELARLEEQRRFDEQMQLREAQFAADQQQRTVQNQLAYDQLAASAQARQMQYAQGLRRDQFGFLSDAMRGQQQMQMFGLQAGLSQAMQEDRQAEEMAQMRLQQAGVGQRHRESIAANIESQRLAARLREMDSYREAILKADLTDEQFAEASSQYEQRFGEPLLQMTPPREEVDDTDPSAVKSQLVEKYPDMPWIVFPDGKVGLPQGWKPEFDPKYREEEHARQVELQQLQIESKADAAGMAGEGKSATAQAAVEQKVKDKWADLVSKSFTQFTNDMGGVDEASRKRYVDAMRETFRDVYGYEPPGSEASPSSSGLIQPPNLRHNENGQVIVSSPSEVTLLVDSGVLRPGDVVELPDGRIATVK